MMPNKYAGMKKIPKRPRTESNDDAPPGRSDPTIAPNPYAGLKVAKKPRLDTGEGTSSNGTEQTALPAAKKIKCLPETREQKREARSRSIDLDNVSRAIQDVLGDTSDEGPAEESLAKLRKQITRLPFVEVWGRLVSQHKLFNEWLPKLVKAEGGRVPEDIILDAQYIYKKWSASDFNTDPLRGFDINVKSGRTKGSLTHTKTLAANYPHRRPCDIVGHNGLIVGQWWPLQMCAMRDGAHGEIEGGIHGTKDKGALSVVLSGGGAAPHLPGRSAGYEDHDYGDRVLYTGTRAKKGDTKPTRNTQYLIEAEISKQPIRLLRSSKHQSLFSPSSGLRYDGLYQVTEANLIDEEIHHYRFTLERLPGQPAIRYTGPGTKPDEYQLVNWEQELASRKDGLS